MKTQLWAIAMVVTGTVIGSFGPIFLKRLADGFSFTIKGIFNKNLIFGLLCYAIGTIMFIPALKGGDLSVLYPLVSVSYIWVCLWSIKFLKERMNYIKWLGILFILIGIAFIGAGS